MFSTPVQNIQRTFKAFQTSPQIAVRYLCAREPQCVCVCVFVYVCVYVCVFVSLSLARARALSLALSLSLSLCACVRHIHVHAHTLTHGQLWPTGSVGAGHRVSRR